HTSADGVSCHLSRATGLDVVPVHQHRLPLLDLLLVRSAAPDVLHGTAQCHGTPVAQHLGHLQHPDIHRAPVLCSVTDVGVQLLWTLVWSRTLEPVGLESQPTLGCGKHSVGRLHTTCSKQIRS